jgi:hypothetical protein
MAADAIPQSQEWFLDVNGRKTGPFSLEQIEGLLREGELQPHQKITAEHLAGRWLTVRELVDHLNESTGFQPPPRPQDLNTPSGSSAPAAKRPDPALSLLSSLQSARQRKENSERAAAVNAAAAIHNVTAPQARRVPVWMLAAGALLVGVGIWGAILLATQQGPSASSSRSEAVHDGGSAPDATKPTAPKIVHAKRVVPPPAADNPGGSADRDSTRGRDDKDDRDREYYRDRERYSRDHVGDDREERDEGDTAGRMAPAPPPAAPPPADANNPDAGNTPPPAPPPEQ